MFVTFSALIFVSFIQLLIKRLRPVYLTLPKIKSLQLSYNKNPLNTFNYHLFFHTFILPPPHSLYAQGETIL